MAKRNWTWEETLMAFALYLVLPSKEHDDRSPEVVQLAAILDRTPNAVALKIANISAHDENRKRAGKIGMTHGSRLDKAVWEEFSERGDALLEDALQLLSSATHNASSAIDPISYEVIDLPEGNERTALAVQRVNQQYFRNTLLENYSSTCCITGIKVEPLLVASHIKPWKACSTKTERLLGQNGLLLNALHDKAFDRGLITLDKEYRIVISPIIKRNPENTEWLLRFEGKQINLPKGDPPRADFIEYHNEKVFQK